MVSAGEHGCHCEAGKYPTSEHLGGVTGPSAFEDPRYVWHHDFVYARASAIHIAELTLIGVGGVADQLVHQGHYIEELEVGI